MNDASSSRSGSMSMAELSFDAFDMPGLSPVFLRKEGSPTVQVGSKVPLELLQTLDASVQVHGGSAQWSERFDALGVPQQLADLVEAMALDLGSREQAWAIVLHWLGQELAGECNLSRQAARIVRRSIKPVDAATLQRWTDALALALGRVQGNTWGKANQTA